MQPTAPFLPWDEIKFFLAVARSGSANRAAAELGVNHTTVGRRVQLLEQRLGVRLFERASGAAMTLTAEGRVAVEEAERMELASNDLLRRLFHRADELAGEVRIRASDGVAAYWLTPALVPFQLAHPELRIRWLVNDGTAQLRRDADIGLGWTRPTAPDLVARKLATIDSALFTTPAYADRAGLPAQIDDLRAHRLMHFEKFEINPAFDQWNQLMRRFRPAIRLENSTWAEGAMRGTGAIALLPAYSPLIAPDIIRLPIDFVIQNELWLYYHESQRHKPGIQAFAAEVVR